MLSFVDVLFVLFVVFRIYRIMNLAVSCQLSRML